MIKTTLSHNLIKSPFKLLPFSIVLLLLFIASCQHKVTGLPYLGEHKLSEKVIDGKIIRDSSYYMVPSFTLTNQDSLSITETNVDGHVYVSYFFFTSCPATCPVMTSAMKRVYKSLGDHKDFMVMAHTVDPKRDTPEKLQEFAVENEIDKDNWQFLTAENDYIYDLGMHGYYLSMGKHDAAPGGFIHSSKFILLDRQRHIRGIYEGTDASEVAKMIGDIKFLLGE